MKFHSKKGFTLIELLVVIAIIAVLATMGTVIFSGITSKVSDIKRKNDVNAIAKAYESRFNGSYSPLQDNQFGNGKIPTPTEGGTYFNDFSSTGFRVCAVVNQAPESSCNSPSSTCYCIDSAQSKYIASVSSPLPSASPLVIPADSSTPQSTTNLVVASYFAWYKAPYFSGTTKHWPPDGPLTDHPKAGLYGIPSGMYDSADPNVQKQQMAVAKSKGIDAFIVSWWGGRDPTLSGDHTDDYIDQNFETMLNTAKLFNPTFRLAIMFESDMEAYHGRIVAEHLYYLLTKYGNHPNYLRHNGIPVVFIYNPTSAMGGDLNNWKTIFNILNQNSVHGFYLGDAFGNPAPSVFNGLWSFGPLSAISQGEATLSNHYTYGHNQAASTSGIWMPTALAGYDDLLFRSPGTKIARDSCAPPLYNDYHGCYNATWIVGWGSQANWMHIGTWNEYHEATDVEESAEYGTSYLDITKFWSDTFKGN